MEGNYNPYELVLRGATENTTGWWGSVANFAPVQYLSGAMRNLYNTAILSSLARLYVYGPRIGGVGFWQGRPPESICAQLTVSNEDFWLRNMDECQRIISHQFGSWVVLLEFLLYFVILWKLVRWIGKQISQRCSRG